jgi:small-conductance mechanosensitive channel
MKNTNFKIGQVINYRNGSNSIYTGTIVKITDRPTLIVIDDKAGMQLFNAGFAVGSEISVNQIVE